MDRVIRITAVPDEDTHPDHVVAAIRESVARIDGADAFAHWIDACADSGAAELVARVDDALPFAQTTRSIETRVREHLSRRRLRTTVTVDRVGRDPGRCPSVEPKEARPGKNASSAHEPTGSALRDDVRRLVYLIPAGRVTTVTTIADRVLTDGCRIASAIDDLVGEHRLPWHRATDRGGRLDTLQDGVRRPAQSARLEAERVPVRHAHLNRVRSLLHRRRTPERLPSQVSSSPPSYG